MNQRQKFLLCGASLVFAIILPFFFNNFIHVAFSFLYPFQEHEYSKIKDSDDGD